MEVEVILSYGILAIMKKNKTFFKDYLNEELGFFYLFIYFFLDVLYVLSCDSSVIRGHGKQKCKWD